MASTYFHTSNKKISLHGRPAVQECFAIVYLVPVSNFLFANFRGELGVLAQHFQSCALYSEGITFGACDLVCVGIEPGLIRQLFTAGAGKAFGLEIGLDVFVGHNGCFSGKYLSVAF